MKKGFCEICQQEKDSVKDINGIVVCSLHITEEEWDEADIKECQKCGLEISSNSIGGEYYDYCKDCGHVNH